MVDVEIMELGAGIGELGGVREIGRCWLSSEGCGWLTRGGDRMGRRPLM